jgi:hypothetical protein
MWQRLAARVLFVDIDVVAVDVHGVGGRVRPAVRPGACVAAMLCRIRTIHLTPLLTPWSDDICGPT